MPYIRCYIASKTDHAEEWRQLDANSPCLKITSRWIKEVALAQCDLLSGGASKEFAARCWIEDLQDIEIADCLILYAEPGEHLRGGLVEAGAALAMDKPVIVIGEHPDFSSWQWHPNVRHFASIPDFEKFIQVWLEKQLTKHADHRHKYP